MLTEFKSFLEICVADKKFVQLDSVKDMLAGIEDTHYFVVPEVHSSNDEFESFLNKHLKYVGLDGVNIPETMDLPFKRCFFQCTQNGIAYVDTFTYNEMAELLTNFDREGFSKRLKERHNLTMDDTLNQVKVKFSSMYVYEVEPKYIRVVAIVNIDDTNYFLPISFSFIDGKLGIGESDFGIFYRQMVIDTALTVIKLLETINHKSWTVVSNDTPVKVKTRVGRNLTKYKYKPSNIVYVYSEHKFRKQFPGLSHKIINKPNYAYEVRGHWRRLQYGQIGKDREGLRGVKGYTWVIPFIKGEGEVMKKVRIVK